MVLQALRRKVRTRAASNRTRNALCGSFQIASTATTSVRAPLFMHVAEKRRLGHCYYTDACRCALMKIQSIPTPPVGSRYSCESTVKLHILPLIWNFPCGKGVVRGRRAQGAAAGLYLGAAGGSSGVGWLRPVATVQRLVAITVLCHRYIIKPRPWPFRFFGLFFFFWGGGWFIGHANGSLV